LEKPERFKALKTVAAIAAALGSILGLIFLFFPRLKPALITNKAVEISNVGVAPILDDPVLPAGGCRSRVNLNFRVRVEGYPKTPLRLYTKLDDSAASPLSVNGLPCPPELGDWHGWNRHDDIVTDVENQTLQLQRTLTIPVRKQNWKIQLKITDANDTVLHAAVSPYFNSR
jgi:hypothetical protein